MADPASISGLSNHHHEEMNMNRFERIRRTVGWTLATAALIAAGACSTVDTTPAPRLRATDTVVVLPLANYTETPDAGSAAQSMAANALRKLGIATVDSMPASPGGDPFDATSQPDRDKALGWARSHHARYALSGAVEEWRYKVGVDGEPVVGMTFELRDVESGKVVWSGTGNRGGWSRSSLGGVAQSLIGKLLSPLAARG